MGGQDDLLTSLEAIMAAKRDELGAPPTPGELLAYRDGGLDSAARQGIEAKIAVHPDAARALADLAMFPAVEAAPGTPDLSDEEVGARWQSFRRRLADLPAPGAGEVRAGEGASPRTVVPAARGWRPPLRLAAAALLGLGLAGAAGFLAGRASSGRAAAAINVRIAELAPSDEGGLRSGASPVDLPAGTEELVLVLDAPRDETSFPAYQVEVVDSRGERVAAREGLRPTPLGTFHLSFLRGALGAGSYRIRLFGREGRSRRLLASYDLRLRLLASTEAR